MPTKDTPTHDTLIYGSSDTSRDQKDAGKQNPKSKVEALLTSKEFDYDSDDFDDVEDYYNEGGPRLTEAASEPPSRSLRPLKQRAAVPKKAREQLPERRRFLAIKDAMLGEYNATLESIQEGLERLRQRTENPSSAIKTSGGGGEDGCGVQERGPKEVEVKEEGKGSPPTRNEQRLAESKMLQKGGYEL